MPDQSVSRLCETNVSFNTQIKINEMLRQQQKKNIVTS